jgi:uncharacterized OsmC-like protein
MNDATNSPTMGGRAEPPLTVQRAIAKGHDGLVVVVDVGDAVVRADMPLARGGTNTAPSPGHLMRASVAACLAIGYKTWAAKLGVPISAVDIELSTDIDMRGQGGAAGVPPGWQAIRWHVRVSSPATEADVVRVLDHADRLSPMLETIHPRCERVRTFEVVRA